MAQNEQYIWKKLKAYGFNDYGIAGLMGNLLAESALEPKNLQNSYNNSLGLSDNEYTKRVDNGTYNNFVRDSAGYGLAQWTYWTRKQALLEYAQAQHKSIGDLDMQLDFLFKELRDNYTTSVYKVLMTTTSVRQASDAVVLKFERPADQSQRTLDTRANYGQTFYNRYSGTGGLKNMTQTYKKGTPVQLSKSFSSVEMDCHGRGCCSETPINPKLVEFLQQIRDHFNKPITITSGYRCPIHNKNVGGATGSRHSKGDAADIVIQGIAPREVAKYAESIGILGIGLYETNKDGHFVHIDTRDYKSYWYGQGQAYRSTFGGSSTNPVSPSQPTAPTTMYMIGSQGEGVKTLQSNLETLGYSLAPYGADGQYGGSTANAVKNFQKDHNLPADGIAGPDTLKAIDKEISKMNNNSNNKVMEVTATGLNVRGGPSMNAPIISMVYRGQKVTVLEEKGGWGKIEEPAGWVSMSYLK